MEDLIISYYKQGLYTLDNLQIFVEAGELSQEKYNALANANKPASSASSNANNVPNVASESAQSKSSFNPVQ